MFSYWILKNHVLRIVDYEEFHIRRTIAAKTKITSIIIEVAYCTLAIYPKNHGPRSHEASLIDTTQSYVCRPSISKNQQSFVEGSFRYNE